MGRRRGRRGSNAAAFMFMVGGPENGKVVYILGTAHRDVGRQMNHLAQGCVLHHDGDDPTLGWELRHQDDADTAV